MKYTYPEIQCRQFILNLAKADQHFRDKCWQTFFEIIKKSSLYKAMDEAGIKPDPQPHDNPPAPPTTPPTPQPDLRKSNSDSVARCIQGGSSNYRYDVMWSELASDQVIEILGDGASGYISDATERLETELLNILPQEVALWNTSSHRRLWVYIDSIPCDRIRVGVCADWYCATHILKVESLKLEQK